MTDGIELVASQKRIATLGLGIVRAIGDVLAEDPDLTWEETLAALNTASARAIGHLLSDDEETRPAMSTDHKIFTSRPDADDRVYWECSCGTSGTCPVDKADLEAGVVRA